MDKEKIDYWNKVANSGEIYDCLDTELLRYQRELVDKLRIYNLTPENDLGYQERERILKKICGQYNEGLCILPPVHANFGLNHVFFGKNVFVNFNSTFVDDANIYIGDNTLIGPDVNIATAIHPISPTLRRYGLQYNKSVRIGENVWIGANATILPGVTIGDNSIIGGGAVVTHDIPSNVIAVGNPARILREITEDDYLYFDKKPISKEILETYK